MDLLIAQKSVWHSALSTPNKIVLLAIWAHWSRSNPQPFPSITRLAAFTALGPRTVRRALQSLEESGWIVVHRKAGRVNTYELSEQRHSSVSCEPFTAAKEQPGLGSRPPGARSNRDGESLRSKVTAWSGPTPEHAEQAAAAGLELELEAIKFRGYYENKGTVGCAWDSQFKAWLIQTEQFQKRVGSQPQVSKASVVATLAGKLPAEEERQGTSAVDEPKVHGDEIASMLAEAERREAAKAAKERDRRACA